MRASAPPERVLRPMVARVHRDEGSSPLLLRVSHRAQGSALSIISAAREDALMVKKHEQEARDAEYAQEVLDHQALLRVVLEGHREGIRRLYGDRSSD